MSRDLIIEHTQVVADLLAIKKTQPDQSDSEIFEQGEVFCCLAGPESWLIEAWVAKLRGYSGAQVDWSFSGGRAIVRYLGGEDAYKRLAKYADVIRPALEEAAGTSQKGTYMEDYPSVQWHMDMPWPGVLV